ncbi:hypothetical protein NWI01_33990 [Nitrobacter winogradskyi]|uniref:Uncharacterized protein n=1 Tax=Nitrobacter winogradskyi TaxID=913 RepID=A0A4Y3WER0_NITWI|nr:hypothetical protein NWI01_33990 [Nitrobacter winogradskyi]
MHEFYVHEFYERLGIRGDKSITLTLLFRERLIHTTVVATAQNHSRMLPSGLFDRLSIRFHQEERCWTPCF